MLCMQIRPEQASIQPLSGCLQCHLPASFWAGPCQIDLQGMLAKRGLFLMPRPTHTSQSLPARCMWPGPTSAQSTEVPSLSDCTSSLREAVSMQPLSCTSTLSCTAAGKAGGFLALDWNDGSPVGDLARLSYKAHQQLAKELGRDIGYCQVNTLSVKAASLKGEPSKGMNLPFQKVSLPPTGSATSFQTLCPQRHLALSLSLLPSEPA